MREKSRMGHVGRGSIWPYSGDAAMTWLVLGVFVLVVFAPGLARRRSEFFFFASRPGPLTPTGVEGVRKLSKQTRAALNAANAMLR